jgi:hypothetical protein
MPEIPIRAGMSHQENFRHIKSVRGEVDIPLNIFSSAFRKKHRPAKWIACEQTQTGSRRLFAGLCIKRLSQLLCSGGEISDHFAMEAAF